MIPITWHNQGILCILNHLVMALMDLNQIKLNRITEQRFEKAPIMFELIKWGNKLNKLVSPIEDRNPFKIQSNAIYYLKKKNYGSILIVLHNNKSNKQPKYSQPWINNIPHGIFFKKNPKLNKTNNQTLKIFQKYRPTS